MNPPRAPVELVTRATLRDLARAARAHPRGRVNLNFHAPEDAYQRLLNAVQPGSFIRPHRHRAPAKSESFVVLAGEIGLFWFDDEGRVVGARRLGPDRETRAVDIAPGVWHTFLALRADTVVFEGKNGPYDPSVDKEFAAWSPAEGDPAAAGYAARLLAGLAEE
jgi:cupin fold WbuC family metalloprotein